MTDKELSDFIEHGSNHFMEFALVFGDGWAGQAIQIAKELRTRLAQPNPINKEPTKLLLIPDLMEQAGWVRKKEWVGLTDEEIKEVFYAAEDGYLFLSKAIEAKLKEKNHE